MRRIFFALALLSIVAVSCQKEASFEIPGQENADPRLEGEWKFLYVLADGETSTESNFGSDIAKSVLVTYYKSINNEGTVRFSGGMVEGTGITYEVDTTVKSIQYLNGLPEDEFTVPFGFVYPKSNVKAPYERIGEDSLYFPQGSFFSTSTSGGSGIQEDPSGARYILEGNLLKFTTRVDSSWTTTSMGEEVKQSINVYGESVFQRM